MSDRKDQVFYVEELKVHSPSGHIVEGEQYDLEIHITHRTKEHKDKPTKYAIIAVFFNEGHTNPWLQSIISQKVPV